MTEPVAEKPDIPPEYGNPTKRLEWADVERKLEAASVYWIASTRPDGRPHVIPRDGTWLDGGLYYGGSLETVHHRNITQTLMSRCTSATVRRRSSSKARSRSRNPPRRWPRGCPMRRSPSTRSTGASIRACTWEVCRSSGRAASSRGRASPRTRRASGSSSGHIHCRPRRRVGAGSTRSPRRGSISPRRRRRPREPCRSGASGHRQAARVVRRASRPTRSQPNPG